LSVKSQTARGLQVSWKEVQNLKYHSNCNTTKGEKESYEFLFQVPINVADASPAVTKPPGQTQVMSVKFFAKGNNNNTM